MFSTCASSASTCSLSSQSMSDGQSPIPTPTPNSNQGRTSRSSDHLYSSADYLRLCETPQNSPLEGQSRPISPTWGQEAVAEESQSKTIKTLYAVYDILCNKIGALGSSSPRNVECRQPPKKYDLTTKLGKLEVSFESSRCQAPPKPGTGALEKILLEPD